MIPTGGCSLCMVTSASLAISQKSSKAQSRLASPSINTGVDYHELDTVYLLPRVLANTAPPALPPYDLAQLIARDRDLTDEKDELYIRVRHISRVQSSLGSERQVELTDVELSVAAVDIADKFSLLMFSAKPSQEQVGRLEASSPHAFWTLGHNVPLCGKCQRDFTAHQKARVQAAALGPAAEMHHLALYSGGGLLDIGLARGCPLLQIKAAVEQHAPAAECHSANILEPFSTIVDNVSNAAEAVYFGEKTELPQPGSLFSLAGGSPCQGFSHANRYKKVRNASLFRRFYRSDRNSPSSMRVIRRTTHALSSRSCSSTLSLCTALSTSSLRMWPRSRAMHCRNWGANEGAFSSSSCRSFSAWATKSAGRWSMLPGEHLLLLTCFPLEKSR